MSINMNLNEMLKVSLKTLKEMLIDRGLEIDNLNSLTENELISLYNENAVFDFKINEDYKVVFYLSSKIQKNKFQHLINEEYKNIIFISREKMTTNNHKSFNEFKSENLTIQFFSISELLFNIYHHELMPEHIPITDTAEINKIMEKYSIKNKHQFPLILHTDPICKYLDIKVDTLVKIVRPSHSSGEYVSYRYCI